MRRSDMSTYNWGDDEPTPGQRVWIDTPPACPQEFKLHGIRPYTRNLSGFVSGKERNEVQFPEGHIYRVALYTSPPHSCWFSKAELSPQPPEIA